MEYELEKEKSEVVSIIETATSELAPKPGNNYSIDLYGLPISQNLLRRLEQSFQESIDQGTRASVRLEADISAGALYAKILSIRTAHQKKDSQLSYVNKRGYVPFGTTKKEPPIFSYSKEEVLEGLNIQQPPSLELPEYAPWRSSIIERVDGWKLEESASMVGELEDIGSKVFRLGNDEYLRSSQGQNKGYDKDSYIETELTSQLGRDKIIQRGTRLELRQRRLRKELGVITGYLIRSRPSGLSMISDEPENAHFVEKDTDDIDTIRQARSIAEIALRMNRQRHRA